MSIHIEEIQGVLTFRMTDVYGAAEIATLLAALEKIEGGAGPVPDRIIDLSAVDSFETDFGNLSKVAAGRRVRTYRNPYRSAFVAVKPVQVGFARMYQTIAQNPSVQFTIVRTFEEAVAWIKGAPVAEKGSGAEVRVRRSAVGPRADAPSPGEGSSGQFAEKD